MSGSHNRLILSCCLLRAEPARQQSDTHLWWTLLYLGNRLPRLSKYWSPTSLLGWVTSAEGTQYSLDVPQGLDLQSIAEDCSTRYDVTPSPTFGFPLTENTQAPGPTTGWTLTDVERLPPLTAPAHVFKASPRSLQTTAVFRNPGFGSVST